MLRWWHGSKRKDDLTTSHIAFAGAQLDWEHRKIREKKEKREQENKQDVGSIYVSTYGEEGVLLKHKPISLRSPSSDKLRRPLALFFSYLDTYGDWGGLNSLFMVDFSVNTC